MQDHKKSMLNLIADLVEKHDLEKDKNLHRKKEVWIKIHKEFCRLTRTKITIDQVRKKWSNHLFQMRKCSKEQEHVPLETVLIRSPDPEEMFMDFKIENEDKDALA